jgi:hypothetical protein
MLLLGVLQAQAAGVTPFVTDYDLLETQVLTSTAASVTFSSLSTYAADYQHLQIRGAARIDLGQPFGSVSLRLNLDTGNNYAKHELGGNGSSVFSSANTSVSSMIDLIQTPGASNDANAFGALVLDVLDPFSTSKYSTVRCLSGRAVSSNPRVGLSSGVWMNTASLTDITLVGQGGSLVTGSRFSLYGIKAA